MENFQIDSGLYLPKEPLPELISPVLQDYENSGAFIQSQEEFAQSISMPGDSITELINKVNDYQAQSRALLNERNPEIPIGPGYNFSVDGAMNKLAKSINPTKSTLKASASPMVLGSKIDYDRYSESGDFQTFGYVPSLGSEQEYRYGRGMTWGDTMGKALAGGGALALDTFVEGWKGWGRMAEALFTWDASKLMGSEEERYELAKQQEAIFNKYAIYNTEQSEDSILNRQFFGNMLQQTGFTVGAIAQMAAESFLTGNIGKIISSSVGAFAKARGLTNAIDLAKLVNDTRKAQNLISKSERVTNGLNNISRSIVPLYGTADDLIKLNKAGAGLWQLGLIGAGGIKRELSIFNMSRSEAIFEAASTYKDMEDRLVGEFFESNGRQPNEAELEKIRLTADNASADNFAVNTGILTVMNRIQFGNMFKSFNTTRKIFNEGLASYADDVLEVTGTVGKKTVRKVYEKGFLGSLGATKDIAATFGKKKAAWEASKSLGRGMMKFEGSEGVQELLQEASNKGLSEYYYDLYNGKSGYGNKFDSIVSNIQNPLTDMDAAKTFLMGALTGRLIAPFSYAVGKANFSKETKDLAAKKTEAINVINSFYADPTQYLKEQIANVKVQNRAAQTMEEAAKNQDRYTFNNAKDSAFAKGISAAIKLNLYDSFKDTLKEFAKEMTPEEFQKAFSMDENKANRKDVNQFVEKVTSQMDDYFTVYNNLKDKYGDRILPELYKNNSPEEYLRAKKAKYAQDQAIEMLTTNVFRARQSTKRAVALTSEMASNPNLGSSATEIVTKLGSEQALDDTIKSLNYQIKTFEQAEELSSEQKEILTQKKEELELATQWKNTYESIMTADDENYTPAIQERAYDAYGKLINFYNKTAKKSTAVTREDIDDNFLRMVDYILLNRDSKNFIDAMNLLADPYNMDIMTRSIADALDVMGKRSQEEHRNEVESIGAENKEPKTPPPPPGSSGGSSAAAASTTVNDNISYSYQGGVYNIMVLGDSVILLNTQSVDGDNNIQLSLDEFEKGLAEGKITALDTLQQPEIKASETKTPAIITENIPDNLDDYLQQVYQQIKTAVEGKGQKLASYEDWKKTAGVSVTKLWLAKKGQQQPTEQSGKDKEPVLESNLGTEQRRNDEIEQLPDNGIVVQGDVITTSKEFDEINDRYDAEYVKAVNEGTMTREEAMQALEDASRKNSAAYKEIAKPVSEIDRLYAKVIRLANLRGNDKTVRQAIADSNNKKITLEQLDAIMKKWDDENGLTEAIKAYDAEKKKQEPAVSTDSITDIEKLVLTDENYNNWSNVRDKSDYDAFVDQVRSTLAMFDQVKDKSKITPETVEQMLSTVKAFANKAVRDQVIPLIVAKYKTAPVTASTDAKADIERRRQEELFAIPNIIKPARGKNINLKDSKGNWKDKRTVIEATEDTIKYEEREGQDYSKFGGKGLQQEYIKKLRVAIEEANKINAKYDAELAALEGTEPTVNLDLQPDIDSQEEKEDTSNDVKDFVQDINQYRKDSVNDIQEANKEFQEGLKQVAPANSLANKTDNSEIIEYEAGKFRQQRLDVNKNYVFDVATKSFMPGQKVTFKVMVDGFEPVVNAITGKKYDKTVLFDKDWNAVKEMHDFIPIGVFANIRGKEVMIGTVHEPQWIERKIGNKYVNIAIPREQIDQNVPDVVKAELKKNRELRQQILDNYNRNHTFVMEGIVENKSMGILRTTESLEPVSKRVNPKIAEGGTDNRHGMFAIVRGGNLQYDRNVAIDNVAKTQSFSSDKIANYQGIALLMLPTPIGEFFPTFIKLPNVSVEQADFIIEAWKAFTGQTSNPELVKAVYDAMGLVQSKNDFSLGILRTYIDHYITQVDEKSISRTGNGSDLPPGSARLNITNKGGLELQVKDANNKWFATDEPITKAEQLPLDYLDKMTNLRTSIKFTDVKNDSLKGINSTEKASILSIKNGKLVNEKITYNQYIMDRAQTYIDKGIESNTAFNDWVYFANPVIGMQVTNASDPNDTKIADNKQTAPAPVTLDQIDQPRLDKGAEVLAAIRAARLNKTQVKEQQEKCSLGSRLKNIM